MSVAIETSKGTFVVDLYYDECPIACKNFLALCQIKYYHNQLFFNVQRDFTIQAGDPSNSGKQGNSIWGVKEGKDKYFKRERSNLKHTGEGFISMVSADGSKDDMVIQDDQGNDTIFSSNGHGSQFIITTADYPLQQFDGVYTIFGSVMEGMDVVEKINEAYVKPSTSVPYQAIRIKHTTILVNPFELDPLFNNSNDSINSIIPPASPEPKHHFEGFLDEDVELSDDLFDSHKTPEEIKTLIAKREAERRKKFLQLAGEKIPHITTKTDPEKVLFVSNINPQTKSSDLEIFFSMYSHVDEVDLITNKQGESIGKAYITFQSKKGCNTAYQKMEGALIDDRVIHVDFVNIHNKQWTKRQQYKAKQEALKERQLASLWDKKPEDLRPPHHQQYHNYHHHRRPNYHSQQYKPHYNNQSRQPYQNQRHHQSHRYNNQNQGPPHHRHERSHNPQYRPQGGGQNYNRNPHHNNRHRYE